MFPAVALLAITAGQAPFQFVVQPDHGLRISLSGVPIVQGSWVQYYEPDWSKAYFNSMNSTVTVKPLDNGDTVLMFKSQDGKAYGTEEYTPLQDGLKVTYTLAWAGDKPVSVELAAATLWADPLNHGTLSADGKPAKSLAAAATGEDMTARAYGTNAKQFVFQAPVGTLTFDGSSSDWTCFDARNLNKTWAKGSNLLWLGQPALTLKPNNVVTETAEWHFTPAATEVVRGGSITLTASPLPQANVPPTNSFTVIPTPRSILVKPDQPFVLNGPVDVDPPSELPEVGRQILDAFRVRWNMPDVEAAETSNASIFVRLQNLNLPAGGYELRISPQNVMIMGQDPEGVRNAISTMAQLSFAKDGKLCLPSGIVRDWPAIQWRGVHLFVGPEALQFHKKLWSRVLEPLKFNKVVVQCERTKWRALPNPKPADYTSREDLLSLFDFYRNIGVEPIPLIESLGHMNWLFADKETDDLALYPDPAMSLDPRIPQADELLSKIWDEAIRLLQPKEIHFGLDEVDLRWPSKDPAMVNTVWQLQLPQLEKIAQDHNCRMMCWGDQCLAAGDAPDAALADTEQDALMRRAFIPKDAIVTDWHYIDDPNPDRFTHTIELWKQDGVTPIAATWFRPENIRGFYLAAAQEGIGTLQTTWAGYQSNEEGMIREFRQFAAMVVAADYAWSARKDDFDKLGYDPYQVFSRMYFDGPSDLSPNSGYGASMGAVTEARIGTVDFRLFDPYSLRSSFSPQTAQLPDEMDVSTPGLSGKTVCLAVDTAAPAENDQPVADVEIDLADGSKITKSLAYGVDVRAANDPKTNVIGPRANGLSLVRIDLPGVESVDKIVFHATSTYAGLRLHGVTAY